MTETLNKGDALSQQLLSKLNARIKRLKRQEKQSNSKCSQISKKLYKYTKFMRHVVVMTLLVMPFFHKPRWCLDQFEHDPQLLSTCGFKSGGINSEFRVIHKGETTDVEDVGIPASKIPKLYPVPEAILNTFCYLVLLYFTVIRVFLRKATKTAKLRTLSISSLLLFLIISNILVIAIGYKLSFWH